MRWCLPLCLVRREDEVQVQWLETLRLGGRLGRGEVADDALEHLVQRGAGAPEILEQTRWAWGEGGSRSAPDPLQQVRHLWPGSSLQRPARLGHTPRVGQGRRAPGYASDDLLKAGCRAGASSVRTSRRQLTSRWPGGHPRAGFREELPASRSGFLGIRHRLPRCGRDPRDNLRQPEAVEEGWTGPAWPKIGVIVITARIGQTQRRAEGRGPRPGAAQRLNWA